MAEQILFVVRGSDTYGYSIAKYVIKEFRQGEKFITVVHLDGSKERILKEFCATLIENAQAVAWQRNNKLIEKHKKEIERIMEQSDKVGRKVGPTIRRDPVQEFEITEDMV